MRVGLMRPVYSEEAKRLIHNLGFEEYSLPLLHIKPLSSEKSGILDLFDRLLSHQSDIFIITSVTAVHILHDLMGHSYSDSDIPALFRNVRVVAIGPSTARALADIGISEVEMPERYSSAGLVDYLMDSEGAYEETTVVEVVRSAQGTPLLVEKLSAIGLSVYETKLYTLVPVNAVQAAPLIKKVLRGELDALLFTSSMIARVFLSSAKTLEVLEEVLEALRGMKIVAIGPPTASVLNEVGIHPIVPEHYTFSDMLYLLKEEKEDMDGLSATAP